VYHLVVNCLAVSTCNRLPGMTRLRNDRSVREFLVGKKLNNCYFVIVTLSCTLSASVLFHLMS